MSNSVVSSVYSGVIKDVIENVKKDFEDSGVEESVLKELERIWDRKIRNAKVATWEANGLSNDDPSQNTNNGSNAMYTYKPDIGSKFSGETPPSLTQQSSQPSASHHGSKVSSGGEISAHTTHHMYKTDNIGYSFDSLDETQTQQQTTQPLYSSVADYPNRAINTMTNNGVGKPSHPIHYPHTPTQATLAPPSDSPSSLTSYPTDVYVSSNNFSIDQKNKFQPTPQMKSMDVKLVPRSTNNPSQQLPEFRREPSLLDNDDINSDLDDSDEEDTNADGEETQNIILCLYDKVTRTKNKWKCQLKDGIMSMNGRDYLFQKGNGDFEF